MNVKTFSIVAGLVAASFTSLGAHAAQADEYTLNGNLPAPVVSYGPRVAERVASVDEFQRNQLAAPAVASSLQRVQVEAEAVAARKLGLITEGERQAPTATAEQAEQIHQAGVQAVQHHVALN